MRIICNEKWKSPKGPWESISREWFVSQIGNSFKSEWVVKGNGQVKIYSSEQFDKGPRTPLFWSDSPLASLCSDFFVCIFPARLSFLGLGNTFPADCLH